MSKTIGIRRLGKIMAASLAMSVSAAAWAQRAPITGYNLQLFQPSADQFGLLSLETSDLPPPGQFTFKAVGNYSRGQLTIVPSDKIPRAVLEKIFTVDSVLSLSLTDFVSVGMSLPYSPYKTGNRVFSGDTDIGEPELVFQSGTKRPLGDFRFFTKWRLHRNDRPGFWPGLGLVVSGTMPTGSEADFTGERKPTVGGTFIVDKRLRKIGITGNLGVKLLQEQTVLGAESDDVLTFGAGVRVPTKLMRRATVSLLGEIAGQTPLTHPRMTLTPVELRTGLQTELPNGLGLLLAGSAGLNDAIGNTDYRAIFGLSWSGKVFATTDDDKIVRTTSVPAPRILQRAPRAVTIRMPRKKSRKKILIGEQIIGTIRLPLTNAAPTDEQNAALAEIITAIEPGDGALSVEIVINKIDSLDVLKIAYAQAKGLQESLAEKIAQQRPIVIRLTTAAEAFVAEPLKNNEIELRILDSSAP